MKNLAILLFITLLTLTSIAQETNVEVAKKTSDDAATDERPRGEKEEFEDAIGQPLASERIKALQKFVKDYPESEFHLRALEMMSGSRAELGDEKLRLSEFDEGAKLFKLAVAEAPATISDRFFSGLLVKFPANLFFRGQRVAAYEVAKMIEERVTDNPRRLLGLATFYLSTENASEAKRLADRAIELDPESSAAYHTVGFAHRLNFELQEASDAFAKALELDPNSTVSKISLAEMKRATGQSADSVLIYKEIVEADSTNSNAQTGLILSLFESGEKDQAETEMAKSLEQNPRNLALLVGAAYWYAANGNGVKAVELAQQVLAFEPRYTWTYIAMARGFMQQGDPLSAERTLLGARKYGNFPTLEYELASTRAAAGFYKEAAEGLRNSFSVENGVLKTKLGGRVEKESESFIELLSLERRASIFQANSADSEENSRILKHLFEFSQNLESDTSDEITLETSVDSFVSGDDSMKFHRQLFAATRLLEKKRSLPKVLEIAGEAVKEVDIALNVPTPSAAVLAEELYQARKLAEARGRAVIVPDIPRQTLSRIMRGRIEEISGWALYQQENSEEAMTRLKTANSVLPQDSAWSRSTNWKIGTILEGEGKSEEALDAYIKGYFTAEQSTAKKIVIENLYSRVYGSLEGLEERLEKKSSDQNAVSIFTGKPKKDDPKPQPEKEDTEDEDKPAANETDANSLATSRIPGRVPIAKSTPEPLVIPTPEAIDENKTVPEDTKSEAVEKLVLTKDEKAVQPKTDAKIVVTNNILNSESNITKLPALDNEPEEAKPDVIEVTDSDSKKPDETKLEIAETIVPKDKTSDQPKTETKIDPANDILNSETNITKLPALTDESEKAKPEVSKETNPNSKTPDGIKLGTAEKIVPKDKTSDQPKTEAKIDITNDILNSETNITKLPELTDGTQEKTIEIRKSEILEEKKPETPKTDKPIFDPIVIKIPEIKKNETLPVADETKKTEIDSALEIKTNLDEEKKPEEVKPEEVKPAEVKPDEVKSGEVKPAEIKPAEIKPEEVKSEDPPKNDPEAGKSEEDKKKDNSGEEVESGLTRPRIVPDTSGKPGEKESDAKKPCLIFLSQDVVTIINNGGSLGVLVGIEEGRGDSQTIKATSSSPEDIEVVYEPEIGKVSGRAFFVIKSISSLQGLFSVTFETPCGEKEIPVKVR